MQDSIQLKGLSLFARIGMTDEERVEPQGLLLDLAIGLDLEAAGNTDDPSLTVDYVELIARIEATAAREEVKLLEALCQRICGAVLQDPRIREVEARLEKFPAVLKGKVTAVAVQMRRTADWR